MVTCLSETTQELPTWVMVFERIGLGGIALLFIGGFVWRALPPLLQLLAAWHKQSDAVTDAIPKVLEGMKDLTNHAERIADHVTSQRRDRAAVDS